MPEPRENLPVRERPAGLREDEKRSMWIHGFAAGLEHAVDVGWDGGAAKDVAAEAWSRLSVKDDALASPDQESEQ